MDLHASEEMDFGRDGALWDADPDVCCAAFQLGACIHTEGDIDGYDAPTPEEEADRRRHATARPTICCAPDMCPTCYDQGGHAR